MKVNKWKEENVSAVIDECVSCLLEEKSEIENRIELLRTLDVTKVTNEEEWHKLCETPLRSSNVMGKIAKQIFPGAELIATGSNETCMSYKGIPFSIPLHFGRGVDIDLSWYKAMNDYYFYDENPKYRAAKGFVEDDGTDWFKQYRRYRDLTDKLVFAKWLARPQWKLWYSHKGLPEEGKKALADHEKWLKKRQAEAESEAQETLAAALIIRDELIPMLLTFTDTVRIGNEQPWYRARHNIDEIIKEVEGRKEKYGT